MFTHDPSTGGRTGVRRFIVTGIVTIALLVTGAAGQPTAADDGAQHRAVTVREERGTYSVTASFHVPQDAAVALAVLTDYEQIPRFMPGVRTSTVVERSAGRAVIEQEAISRFMMFSKRVHLVLDIVEGPDTVRFRDRAGDSFVRYEGAWRLCVDDGRTRIVYELTAQPSFDVPRFLLTRLLKRDSGEMIDSLQREIAARAAR